MWKKCQKCGKEFEARETYFKLCPNCFAPSKHEIRSISEFLLKSYYDQENNLLKEVFIDIPRELANIFANSKPPLKTKQLRNFHQKILRARNKTLLKGINVARPILYECGRDAAYQLKRGIIPQSFNQFLEHHLPLAEKDEKMLEGFYQHLDSIVCYSPKEKKGG